jgi:hypothetical protein
VDGKPLPATRSQQYYQRRVSLAVGPTQCQEVHNLTLTQDPGDNRGLRIQRIICGRRRTESL